VIVTDAVNHTNSHPLPEGWDSCPDKESGEIYYFNYETGRCQDIIFVEAILLPTYLFSWYSEISITGLTQWERPHNPHQREVVPITPSAEVDLLRWKQLREEAEIKIDNLR
jgi:hypothetical protein